MDGGDTKMMVHIGTELLLIGGLGFWMKKRVDTLDLQVEELNKKISVYEKIISQQQQILASHESVLRQAFGIPQSTTEFSTGKRDAVPKPKEDNAQQTSSPIKREVETKPLENVQQNVQQDATEEDDISPEDLDEILRQELGQDHGQETSTLEIDTVENSQETLKPKKKIVSSRKKKAT